MLKYCYQCLVLSLFYIFSMPLCADEITELTLANGLKIIVKPDQRSPVAIFQIWYKVGSADEQKGQTGISHLLEHLMYRSKTPVSDELYLQMGAIGSLGNAYTKRDHTFYFHSLKKNYLHWAFALEAERMKHLNVPMNTFEIEKKIIKQERLERINQDPYLKANNALYRIAFKNDSYQFPVIGLPDDLPRLTLKQAKEWHKQFYTPDNATIVVIGDIKPDEVFSLAKKYFMAIKKQHKQSTPMLPFNDNAESSGLRFIMPDESKVGVLFLAFKVPSINTAAPTWEAYALDVLAGWLDSGKYSRLSKILVRDKQIAHEVQVNYAPMNRKQSLFIIEASPAHGVSLKQLEQEIVNELKLLKKELMSDAALQNVKNQMTATEIFERDSMYTQAKIIGQAESVGIHWSEDAHYIQRIKMVTSAQINQVMQTYFNFKKIFVVIQK